MPAEKEDEPGKEDVDESGLPVKDEEPVKEKVKEKVPVKKEEEEEEGSPEVQAAKRLKTGLEGIHAACTLAMSITGKANGAKDLDNQS
jgi:hypothetical protein